MKGSRVEPVTSLQRLGLTVLWLYLCAPLLIQAWMGGLREFTDVLFLMTVALSLLWLAVGHFSVRRPVLLHLALAPRSYCIPREATSTTNGGIQRNSPISSRLRERDATSSSIPMTTVFCTQTGFCRI
jgi:hypothetical protein